MIQPSAPGPHKPLKGIVFDLDGTLIDSLAVTFGAFNHGIESQGGKRHTPEELMKHFGTGEDEIFAAILGREKAAAAYEACRRYVDEHVNKIPFHAGVPELLDTLKSRGVPISIFTGRSWKTTEVILKHHGALDRFVTVVANDHIGQPKPSPEGLHLVLKRMRLEPSEVLFVGDTDMDMQAARTGGSRGVGALWDLLADRKRMELFSPHHWAEKPAQVLEIFERHR